MEIVIFSSPGREEMLAGLLRELQYEKVHVIDSVETFGKEKFWLRWEIARRKLLQSASDDFLILPDDVCGIDLNAVRQIHDQFRGKVFTCSVINDGRKSCWGSRWNKVNDRKVAGYTLRDLGFFDCGGITNRETLKRVTVTEIDAQWLHTRTSSGVGHQLTNKLRKIGAKMFIPHSDRYVT